MRGSFPTDCRAKRRVERVEHSPHEKAASAQRSHKARLLRNPPSSPADSAMKKKGEVQKIRKDKPRTVGL